MKKLIILTLIILGAGYSFAQQDLTKPIKFPKDTSERLRVTFKLTKGYLGGYSQSPAIIRSLRNAYGRKDGVLVRQRLPIDRVNNGFELGVERFYKNGLYVSGRINLRQLHEFYFEHYSEPKTYYSETYHIWTQQNFVGSGISVGYDIATYKKLRREFRVHVYGGIDGRISFGQHTTGEVYLPLLGIKPIFSSLSYLDNYELDKVYFDPIIGANFKWSYLTFDVRIQSFNKNYMKPINSYGIEVIDRLNLTSLGVGVNF